MKKLTAALAAFLLMSLAPTALAIATTASTAFTDTAGHIYESDIKLIADNGFVQGYDDGSYKPDALINRAEFSKIIIKSTLTDEADMSAYNNCFQDVKDEWYAIYVCFAKDKGIIQGYDDGNFRPSNDISIAEASKIIIGGLMGSKITAAADVAWYVPYMEKLSYYNAIPPTLKYKAADTQITRGEMAYMISTLIQWKAAREDTTSTEALSATGNVYGSPDAEISLVVFTDFECPFCAKFHATAQKIVDDSGGEVNLEYKTFPLEFHENALFEAAASRCASSLGTNGKYWDFVGEMFAGSYADTIAVESAVRDLSMNVTDFYDCMAGDAPWDAVDEDYRLGLSIGVSATPSTVVRNNQTGAVLAFEGAQTEETVIDIITQVRE